GEELDVRRVEARLQLAERSERGLPRLEPLRGGLSEPGDEALRDIERRLRRGEVHVVAERVLRALERRGERLLLLGIRGRRSRRRGRRVRRRRARRGSRRRRRRARRRRGRARRRRRRVLRRILGRLLRPFERALELLLDRLDRGVLGRDDAQSARALEGLL